MTKQFKYSEQHAQLSCECPDLNQLEPINATGYRFVFKDSTHRNCSSPNLINNPGRKTKSCEERCKCWALSFWRDFSQAEILLRHYLKTNKNFATNVGDYIAECTITEEDGLAEKKSGSHINLHEFVGTDFTNRFVNLKHIKP